MRKLWKLAMVCAGMFMLVGGLRQAEGTPVGVCPWGSGNPYCLNFEQCRDYCATFPDALPAQSICTKDHCCLCVLDV